MYKKCMIIFFFLIFIFLTGCDKSNEEVEQSISFNVNQLILKENEGSSIPIYFTGIEQKDIVFSLSNDWVVDINILSLLNQLITMQNALFVEL